MNEYVLNNLQEGIMIFDEESNLRFCNESVRQKLEYTSDELIAMSMGKIIFSKEHEEIKIRRSQEEVNLYIKTIHNKEIPVSCRVIEAEWRGEKAYWVIINKYEEKAYTVEDLERILESLPFGVWISDEKDVYKYANSHVMHILSNELDIECRDDEIIENHGFRVWRGCVQKGILKKDHQALIKGQIISEDRGINQGERKFGYHLIKIPNINKEGIFKGYVGMVECNIFQENFEELVLAIGSNECSNMMNINKIGKQIKKLLTVESKTARLLGSEALFICKYEEEKKKLKCICHIGEKQPGILESIEMDMESETYHTFIQREEWKLSDLEKYVEKHFCDTLKAIGIIQLRVMSINSGNQNMAVMVMAYKEPPRSSAMEIRNGQNLCKHIGMLLKNHQLSLEINKELKKRREAEEERLTYKEALEMESLKNEFINNMSHELKTPLNIIYSMLQLVELELEKIPQGRPQEIDAEKLKRYRQLSKQNVFRLLRLINNITEVSHIGTGYYSIKKVNCNVVKIIEDITMSVVDYVRNKKLDIIFDTEIEELTMGCDPEKIERIILNLLSNAVKYTDEGGEIWVNLEVRERNLVILVKDNGIGIPKDKQENIFQRFVQVDSSFTRKCEGSGIGLALVKSLVELHNGTIGVESELGQGSTFIVTIPIQEAEEELTVELNVGNTLVEKCNIEFSDIYDI